MRFTESHEWITLEGDIATVGITDYAQKELGDIVYVELPRVGHEVIAGEEVAVLESTKAAIDLYSPLTGTVEEANETLRESPERVNTSPHADGWIFKLKLSDPADFNTLLSKKEYNNLLNT